MFRILEDQVAGWTVRATFAFWQQKGFRGDYSEFDVFTRDFLVMVEIKFIAESFFIMKCCKV